MEEVVWAYFEVLTLHYPAKTEKHHENSHHSLSTSWIFNLGLEKWCHWGANWMWCSVMSLGCWLFECDVHWCHWDADCWNVMFSDITGALNDWILHSMMSLGCWLVACDVQSCHWSADCLNVMFSDVTAGTEGHISLGVMTVCVTPRFFP